MTEINCLYERLLGLLIVLLLEGVDGLGVQGDIVAPKAALGLGIVGYAIGYLLGLDIVLMGGLVSTLIAPSDIEQSLVALLLTLALDKLGYLEELVALGSADESQHLSLKLGQVIGACSCGLNGGTNKAENG